MQNKRSKTTSIQQEVFRSHNVSPFSFSHVYFPENLPLKVILKRQRKFKFIIKIFHPNYHLIRIDQIFQRVHAALFTQIILTSSLVILTGKYSVIMVPYSTCMGLTLVRFKEILIYLILKGCMTCVCLFTLWTNS